LVAKQDGHPQISSWAASTRALVVPELTARACRHEEECKESCSFKMARLISINSGVAKGVLIPSHLKLRSIIIYHMLVDAHMEMHYCKKLFEMLCVIFIEKRTD
jgi:hypothetical protein